MLRTQKIFSLGLAGLLVSGAGMAAHADTITLGPQTITSGTDFSGSFLFTKFDPSLGTLNSVFLTLGNTMTTTLTVTNNSGTTSSGNARTELQAALADTGTSFSTAGNVLTPSGGLFNVTDDFQTSPAGYSLSGTGSTVLSPSPKSSSVSSAPGFTGSSVLAYFTGASGSAQINYLTFTSTNLNNTGGNTSVTQATNDSLSATVVYNYTPFATTTPEPGTWAMLIAGASTGLVAIRRRRNKK